MEIVEKSQQWVMTKSLWELVADRVVDKVIGGEELDQ